MMAGTFIPIALAGLALLAGKALIVSKLALVLAGIIGLKKLLGSSGGGHHESSYQVVSGHGIGRSIQDPHLLAYRSYAPS
jgi:lactoylglutathione lyase